MQRTFLPALFISLLFAPGLGRAADTPEPAPLPPAVRPSIHRAAPDLSPVPRAPRPPSIPADIFDLITPGAERFLIAGLSIGAGPQAVQQFLDSKGLHPVGNPGMGSILADHGLQKISYSQSCSYTNDKTGAGKIEVKLIFTAPFPSSEGYVSRVSGINYTTYFGAGVKYDEIRSGLIERFGEPQFELSNRGSMNWSIRITRGSNNFPATSLSSQVSPPISASGFCKLLLQLDDSNFANQAQELASESLNPAAPSGSPQDTTKPSY